MEYINIYLSFTSQKYNKIHIFASKTNNKDNEKRYFRINYHSDGMQL